MTDSVRMMILTTSTSLFFLSVGYHLFLRCCVVPAIYRVTDPEELEMYKKRPLPQWIHAVARSHQFQLLVSMKMKEANNQALKHIDAFERLNSKAKKKFLKAKKQTMKEEMVIPKVEYGEYKDDPTKYTEDTKPKTTKTVDTHPTALSESQETALNLTIAEFINEHPFMKKMKVVPLKKQLEDHRLFFTVGSNEVDKHALMEEILSLTGMKKTNKREADLILSQYTKQKTGIALTPKDEVVSAENDNTPDDSDDESLIEDEQPQAPTQQPILHVYAKQKNKMVIENLNQPNAFKRLLEIKHALLKRAQQIYHLHEDQTFQPIYRQITVIRHGLIHLDFKNESMSDAVRIAFYQDTFNKLNTPDFQEAQLNIHHDIYQTFNSESVVWKDDQAKHIESDFVKAMDMINARVLTLQNPTIEVGTPAHEMLIVEIGEIYAQLRNSGGYHARLNGDPCYLAAVEARNEFAHQGQISAESLLRFAQSIVLHQNNKPGSSMTL
jgi:hypothetical protein